MGEGRVLVGEEVETLLKQSRVTRGTPVRHGRSSAYPETGRRRNLYFLVNRGMNAIREYLPLAKPASGVVMLDPMTGQAGVVPVRDDGGTSEVLVDLAPGQSVFIRTFRQRTPEGPAWHYREPVGEALPLTGPWHVEFIQGGPALPKACNVHDLATWTAFPDNPATEAFAGTARYSPESICPRP